MGRAAIVRPAKTTGQSVSSRLCMETRPTGRVLSASSLMNTSAKTNSFQAKSAWSSAADTRMGRHIGRVMRQKVWAREAPSIVAASSTSLGSSIVYARIRKVVKGIR